MEKVDFLHFGVVSPMIVVPVRILANVIQTVKVMLSLVDGEVEARAHAWVSSEKSINESSNNYVPQSYSAWIANSGSLPKALSSSSLIKKRRSPLCILCYLRGLAFKSMLSRAFG